MTDADPIVAAAPPKRPSTRFKKTVLANEQVKPVAIKKKATPKKAKPAAPKKEKVPPVKKATPKKKPATKKKAAPKKTKKSE